MNTVRMTIAKALVKFLDNQYISFDGVGNKFVEGIFGHEMWWGWGKLCRNLITH